MLRRALFTLGGIIMAAALIATLAGCAADPTPWPEGKPTSAPIGCEVLRERAPGEC